MRRFFSIIMTAALAACCMFTGSATAVAPKDAAAADTSAYNQSTESESIAAAENVAVQNVTADSPAALSSEQDEISINLGYQPSFDVINMDDDYFAPEIIFNVEPAERAKEITATSSDESVLKTKVIDSAGQLSVALDLVSCGYATVKVWHNGMVIYERNFRIVNNELLEDETVVVYSKRYNDPSTAWLVTTDDYCEYRLVTDSEWKVYDPEKGITENGVYLFREKRDDGTYKKECRLEINDLSVKITEKQMPDKELLNFIQTYFYDRSMYEGDVWEDEWFNFNDIGVHSLKGLSLLDLSKVKNFYAIDNYIEDITELDKIKFADGCKINLNYNQLDLGNKKVVKTICNLRKKGYDVTFTDQNRTAPDFNKNPLTNLYNLNDYTSLTIGYVNTYPLTAEDAVLTCESEDTDIVTASLVKEYQGKFSYSINAEFTGKTGRTAINIFLNGEKVETYKICAYKDELPTPILKISYNGGSNPLFYIDSKDQLNGLTLEYKQQSGENWQKLSGGRLMNVDTYEFRYSKGSAASQPISFELKYVETEDGFELFTNGEGWTVYGRVKGGDNIIIPEEFEGKKITEVLGNAVPYSAKTLTLPRSVKYIDTTTAWSLLEKLTIDQNNPYYKSVDNCIIQKETGTFVLSNSKNEIPNDLSIKQIGEGAFKNHFVKLNIRIPASVTYIDYRAFNNHPCSGTIEVDPANKYFVSTENCIIERNSGRLIISPNGVIPSGKGIKVIGDSSIRYCKETLVVPDGVAVIENNGINRNWNSDLKTIYLPESLLSLGYGAFTNFSDNTTFVISGDIPYISDSAFGSNYSNITIKCYEDSAIYKFAKNKGIKVELLTRKSVESEANAPANVEVSGSNESLAEEGVKLSVSKANDAQVGTAVIKEQLKNLGINSTAAFDIKLVKENGETAQPNATVKVSIDVPEGMNGKNCRIFRVEEDGTLTDMNAEFVDGKLCFYTEHFSLYMIAQERSKEVIAGDLNYDGIIDIRDLIMLKKSLAKGNTIMGKDPADVNGDGALDQDDLVALKKMLIGA